MSVWMDKEKLRLNMSLVRFDKAMDKINQYMLYTFYTIFIKSVDKSF